MGAYRVASAGSPPRRGGESRRRSPAGTINSLSVIRPLGGDFKASDPVCPVCLICRGRVVAAVPVASIWRDAPAPEPGLPDGTIGFEEQQVWIRRIGIRQRDDGEVG